MFSIIAPLDPIRLKQFKVTKLAYDSMDFKKEFIIPTRNESEVHNYLARNRLLKDVKLIPYKIDVGFNVSKALNLGVNNAAYGNIIITSPEVKPVTDVLEQLSHFLDKNVICNVDDQDEHGNLSNLVSSEFRSETPAMYFLGMFKKEDIEAINGWDEEFMKGYAYEDNDFGDRWVRAGLTFEVHDEIKGVHQYHPRSETLRGGTAINMQHYHDNIDNGVIKCKNGLKKLWYT